MPYYITMQKSLLFRDIEKYKRIECKDYKTYTGISVRTIHLTNIENFDKNNLTKVQHTIIS